MRTGRFRGLHFLFLPLCLTIYLIAGFSFAQRQTLWLDETTQLSGIPLGPVEVTRWLAGAPHDFGCPTAPDRMPPVSYWAGQLWVRGFGFSELALRYMGVACVAGAVALVYAAGRRAFGAVGGLAAGLYLAVSPAVLDKLVEIRAYPLYLLLGA
ncbi:MAG: glycosyltransferase family 39 protein, partial [Phycisphaerae bacterium]